jgi:hypothetical protein
MAGCLENSVSPLLLLALRKNKKKPGLKTCPAPEKIKLAFATASSAEPYVGHVISTSLQPLPQLP